MKNLFILALLLLTVSSFAQDRGNYVILINGDSIYINLEESRVYKTKEGNDLDLKLIQPKVLTYSDEMISFNYSPDLNVSNTILEEGIEQCLVMKSTGSGFLVQKYSTMNPDGLISLMLNEITKESVSYGYKRTDKKFKKKLLSGETIEGLKVTLKYQNEKQVYTVATYGKKDSGILVLTMILHNEFNDMEIIDLFLNTLQINK